MAVSITRIGCFLLLVLAAVSLLRVLGAQSAYWERKVIPRSRNVPERQLFRVLVGEATPRSSIVPKRVIAAQNAQSKC